MASRMRWIGVAVVLMLLCNFSLSVRAEEDEEEEQQDEHVLTLDHSNFTQTVGSHDFIVVEFYAPWCGHCKKLAPEYEEAASVLSGNDPPLTLAKIDASAAENREVAIEHEIQGFPTIKIFRNGGNDVRDYKGPHDAAGMVTYLKKQAGPASVELKTPDDVQSSVDEAKVVVVGIFPSLSGEEFENFTTVADKLRSDYDFCHTLDAKLLPKGESSPNKPTVRLLKPFDELFIDFTDFDVDSLEKFVEEASIPIVTVYDNNPNNQPFLMKFFNSPESKVMLLANFDDEGIDALTTEFKDVATTYKGKGVIFLLGEIEASQGLIQYFGLKADQMPLIIVQTSDDKKYLKPNLKSNGIASWFKEYMDGNVKRFVKSEPIPEANNEPVKVVVANTLNDLVFESGKNVLLEFYAPWCGHCQKLAPTLNEVALSFKNDPDIVIAKMDVTANDLPREIFEVKGLPTMYLKSSTGSLVKYEGDRTEEDIIEFIQKNRDTTVQPSSDVESTATRDEL